MWEIRRNVEAEKVQRASDGLIASPQSLCEAKSMWLGLDGARQPPLDEVETQISIRSGVNKHADMVDIIAQHDMVHNRRSRATLVPRASDDWPAHEGRQTASDSYLVQWITDHSINTGDYQTPGSPNRRVPSNRGKHPLPARDSVDRMEEVVQPAMSCATSDPLALRVFAAEILGVFSKETNRRCSADQQLFARGRGSCGRRGRAGDAGAHAKELFGGSASFRLILSR